MSTTRAETESGVRTRDEVGAEAGVGAEAPSKMVIYGLHLDGEPKDERNHIGQEEKKRNYDKLWKSGLHYPKHPLHTSETVLITELTLIEESNKLFVVQNIPTGNRGENKGHSENLLFEWIKKNLKKLESENLIIYISYTPCAKCCKDINAFCRENEDFKITFICSQLYNIKRPSCLARKKCECHNFLSEGESDLMVKARSDLNKNVKILPSNCGSWRNLKKLLSHYTSHDDNLDDDVDKIRKGVERASTSDNNRYTRPNKEDYHLSKDFETLKLIIRT